MSHLVNLIDYPDKCPAEMGGYTSVLSPQTGVEGFQSALQAITKGSIFTDEHGLKALRHPKAAKNTLGITNREQQIIDLVVQGYSNKQIGERLLMTQKAVKCHLRTVFPKLHVPNRAKLTSLIVNNAQIETRRRERTKSALTRPVKSSRAALDRHRRWYLGTRGLQCQSRLEAIDKVKSNNWMDPMSFCE